MICKLRANYLGIARSSTELRVIEYRVYVHTSNSKLPNPKLLHSVTTNQVLLQAIF